MAADRPQPVVELTSQRHSAKWMNDATISTIASFLYFSEETALMKVSDQAATLVRRERSNKFQLESLSRQITMGPKCFDMLNKLIRSLSARQLAQVPDEVADLDVLLLHVPMTSVVKALAPSFFWDRQQEIMNIFHGTQSPTILPSLPGFLRLVRLIDQIFARRLLAMAYCSDDLSWARLMYSAGVRSLPWEERNGRLFVDRGTEHPSLFEQSYLVRTITKEKTTERFINFISQPVGLFF